VDWLLFGLAVAAMAVIGVAIGLVVAPRLTRWSDRAAREADGPEGDEPGSARDGEPDSARATRTPR
jgi:hypothetical protein